jgi:hypothetical protein
MSPLSGPRIGQTVRQITSQLADDPRIVALAVRIDQFHRWQLRQAHAMTDDPQGRRDQRTGGDGDPVPVVNQIRTYL